MKFKKEDLVELAGGYSHTDFESISDEVTDTSRWSVHYNQIFKYDGKFYSTNYSRGATEMQDESPYEHESGDEIECAEVFAREKTITVYETAEQQK